MNQNKNAKKTFQDFLAKYPNHAEARLKFAEALLRLEKFQQARDEAMKINDPAFRLEARLIAAQANMAMGKDQEAYRDLNLYSATQEWDPIFEYWKGMAKYNQGDFHKALEHFRFAYGGATPGLWTKEASKPWILQILSELRTIRARANLGYFIDGNVNQYSNLPIDSNGDATLPAPLKSSYLKDNGYIAGMNLTFLLLHSPGLRLLWGLDASTTEYFSHKTSSNQSLASSISAIFPLSKSVDLSVVGKFADSRYQYLYYQDTASLAAEVSWKVNNRLRFGLDSTYSLQVKTRHGTTKSAGINGSYLLGDSTYVSLGGTFTATTGDKATYYSTYAAGSTYALSGTTFSNYKNAGLYSGISVLAPWDFILKLQASRYWNNYAHEGVIAAKGGNAPKDRTDVQTSLGAEVSHPIIKNIWLLSLSHTLTINRSTGFQGLNGTSTVANYNYRRPYTLVSSSFYF